MKNLIKEFKKEKLEQHKRRLAEIDKDGIDRLMSCYGKTYKGDAKAKLINWLTLKYQKELNEGLQQIEKIKNSEDFKTPLVITVEWKRSYMWGSNPKAFTNFGFISRSIGGCGYDKKSTATAYALNSDLRILKLLYLAKDKAILKARRMKNKDGTKLSTSDTNRQILGYGAGYSVLPQFKGGVGVESHRTILARLGLEMEHSINTDNTDVFTIRRA